MTGRRLQHYEIGEKLGQGGMGVVYKARDTHLDRFVALKVLPPERMADPERKRRFVQEAKAASALNHPHIVTIHDIAQAEGIDFIVMEYVTGQTLDQLIPRRGMRLIEALKHAVEIAGALEAAHAAGIIHRDLKPGNVMVSAQGRVKVLDFGLAKLTEPEPTSGDAPTESLKPATEEGVILGTASYMSPEQAQGRPLDARSDIFSFGALLYEMVTGRRAFDGGSKMSTLAAILNQEPAPLASDIPHDLEKLIARCLRKDPARRFQHMDDVKVALTELKEESDSGKLAAVAPPHRRRWLWALALPALVAAGALAYYLLFLRNPPAAKPLAVTPLTSYPGEEWSPTLAPDGDQVAFTWNGEKQDNFDIYVQMIGTGGRLRLTTDPAIDYGPAWSPDRRYIAFLRQLAENRSAILLIPAIGGPERKLGEAAASFDALIPFRAARLAWSPDGNWLALSENSSLILISAKTGERRPLPSPPAGFLDRDPAFSPDARTLAFLRGGNVFTADLFTVPLGRDFQPDGPAAPLARGLLRPNAPLWAPRGNEILFSSGELANAGFWRIHPGEAGLPRQVNLPTTDVNQASLSRDGSRLVFAQWYLDTDVWRLDLDPSGRAGQASRAISSTRPEYMAQMSPDGRRIAFNSHRSGSTEIWVCESDASNPIPLTSFGGPLTRTPRWSPDGETIAFDSRAEGNADLYVINSRGGKPRRLTSDSAEDHGPSWSADGKWIFFASNRSGADQVWKMPAGGGEPVQVTRHGGSANIEPVGDGALLYTKTQGGAASLWRLNLASGEETRLVESLYRWASYAAGPNGVYFVRAAKPGAATPILFLEFSTGAVRTVAIPEKPIRLCLALAPGGRTLLFDLNENTDSDLMLVENFR